MKFFTAEWHGGALDEARASRIPAAYHSHIDALAAVLPSAALQLGRGEVNLHDGLITSAIAASGALELVIRAGDLQQGYFDARLTYGGCEATEAVLAFLLESQGQRHVEILYDEIDEESGHFVHRFLFWPYHEIAVTFRRLDLETKRVQSRFEGGAA